MAELPSVTEITSLMSLLAPGLLITSIRSRVITGSVPDFKDQLISYGFISIGYFAAVAPLFHVQGGLTLPSWLWNCLQYFVVPVILGIASAYIHQWKIIYRLSGYVGLQLAHHIPAAWDYTFKALPAGSFVLVTMQDGTKIPGKMGPNSFASSSREERDVLIEELWQIDQHDQWSPVLPVRNILLCGKDIRYIEFF